MQQPPYLWGLFFIIILSLVIFDLSFTGTKRQISFRTSLILSGIYILLGLSFGGIIWYNFGKYTAYEYYTGFLIEKTLSLDNIFIFSMIFSYFQIPTNNHHRVLFYGILGVIIFRGIMISLGSALLYQFEWILYLFGGILILTGIKLLSSTDKEMQIADNLILKVLQKMFNISNNANDRRFIYWKKTKLYLTPAFVALLMIETMDVIFAIDSIPAIFAITDNLYVIYTSNVFAILGLRALYFCLDGVIEKFYYLKYSIALILVLIGIKIFVTQIYGKIPAYISLSATIFILAMGVIYSLYRTQPSRE